jgi:hypothetical protein
LRDEEPLALEEKCLPDPFLVVFRKHVDGVEFGVENLGTVPFWPARRKSNYFAARQFGGEKLLLIGSLGELFQPDFLARGIVETVEKLLGDEPFVGGAPGVN